MELFSPLWFSGKMGFRSEEKGEKHPRTYQTTENKNPKFIKPQKIKFLLSPGSSQLKPFQDFVFSATLTTKPINT